MSDQKYTDVGAGWIKTTQKGDKYISISFKEGHGLDLSQCWVSLMKNTRKGTNPKAPDYTLTAKPKDEVRKAPPAQKQEDIDEFGF